MSRPQSGGIDNQGRAPKPPIDPPPKRPDPPSNDRPTVDDLTDGGGTIGNPAGPILAPIITALGTLITAGAGAITAGAGAGLIVLLGGLLLGIVTVASEAIGDAAADKDKLTKQQRRRSNRCHSGGWWQPGDDVAGTRSSKGNIIYHPPKPLRDQDGRILRDRYGKPILVASGAEACFPGKSQLGGGTSPNQAYKPPGWVDGVGMDRGHLIAKSLGGDGRNPNNIVPICLNANRGRMRVIEEDIRRRVEDPQNGETVYYRVTPRYHSGNPVPYELHILAVGERSGVLYNEAMPNPWEGGECGKLPQP